MSGKAEDSLLLVSGGDDVKYWSFPSVEQVGCKNFGVNINAICWSPNSAFLAAALESTGIRIIGHQDNYESFTLATKDVQFCVSVSDNSRYVLTGGKDTVVSIWDLKHKTIKKSFRDHLDVVHAACFNRNYTAIASGDGSGEVYVHNIVTDAADGPFRGDSTQAIRGLQYSYFRKNLLATASDDAALNLWDTSTKQLAKCFNTYHTAPTSDLSFSPVNDMLLASVGLDKRLVFYDVVGKKSVKTINAESPLTSVEFYNDGATIAAGSSSGKILLFDLRSGSTPIRVVQAHRTSVRCMAFKKGAKSTDKSSSRKSTEAKVNGTRAKLPVTTPTTIATVTAVTIEAKVKPVVKATPTVVVSPQAVSKIDGDIFSPIKDDSVQDTSISAPGENEKKNPPSTSKSKIVEVTPVRVVERPGLGRRGISDLSYSKSAYSRRKELSSSSDGGTNEALISDVFSPCRNDSEDIVSPSLSTFLKVSDSGTNQVPFSTETGSSRTVTAEGRKPSGSAEVTIPSAGVSSHTLSVLLDSPISSVSQELASTTPKESKSGSVSSLLAEAGMKAAFSVAKGKEIKEDNIGPAMLSPAQRSSTTSTSGVVTSSHQGTLIPKTVNGIEPVGNINALEATRSETETQPVLHPFQIEYIRNMIEDAMDDSRMAIHQDLVNVQIEFLRQLKIQEDGLKRIVQQYSINEELVKENERLREEIKNLKTKY